MPIKSLTDRGAAFPIIGTLRKGAPRPQNGNRPGADLEYFRFEPKDADDAALVEAFHDAYGAEPRELAVFLPYATPEENFQAWQEAWVAGGLVHRCDGEFCVLWLDEKKHEYVRDAEQVRERACPGGCAPVGRLFLFLRHLKRMALVVALTSSKHDIMTLQENLTAMHQLAGPLNNIPMILKRVPRQISTPGPDGKRVRREKWLLSIEADPEWVERKMLEMARAALPALTTRLLDTATGEIIETAPEPEDSDADVVDSTGDEAPPEPESDAGDSNGNTADGQPTATVRTGKWAQAHKVLAEKIPYWQDKAGKPNLYHMLGAAGKLGFAEINDGNLPAVIEKLTAYANQKANEEAARQERLV